MFLCLLSSALEPLYLKLNPSVGLIGSILTVCWSNIQFCTTGNMQWILAFSGITVHCPSMRDCCWLCGLVLFLFQSPFLPFFSPFFYLSLFYLFLLFLLPLSLFGTGKSNQFWNSKNKSCLSFSPIPNHEIVWHLANKATEARDYFFIFSFF